MSEESFEDLLEGKAEDAERPKPLPVGLYGGMVESHEFGRTSKKGTPYVRYTVNITEAIEVDEDALEEAGGAARIAKAKVNTDFYLTEDARWRLREFMETKLEDFDISGKSWKELVPEVEGQAVRFILKHEPNQRDITAPPYVNIERFLSVDEED